jgi:hypothetical protein
MTGTRIALVAGIVFLTAFVIIVAFARHLGLLVVVVLMLAVLIGAGNLLYGRHSHGAAAMARTRTAQEAHDRAADVAAEARRATAEAAKRGERYCPLDPSNQRPAAGP